MSDIKYIVTFWNGFDEQAKFAVNEREVIQFLSQLTPDFRERCRIFKITVELPTKNFIERIKYV